MAVKLRLKRMGSKKRPFYRIVAADSRSPRDGRFIETVGTYHPIYENNNITLDEEKILKWLKNGALPTDTVKNILTKNGVWAKFKQVPSKKVKQAPVKTAEHEEKPKAAPKKATVKKVATKTATKTAPKKTTTTKATPKKTTKKSEK